MDTILNQGILFILFLQSLGSWLLNPMKLFSALGNEQFYLFIAPAILWCFDAGLGMRMGLGLTLSSATNSILKLAFHMPRPFWYDARVQPLSTEASFGAPSGHSQNAVVVWGILANWINRPWAWAVAITLMFFIGLSRMYLGVHFPVDVLSGWLFGALLLWAILRFEAPVIRWLSRYSTGGQVLIIFLFSLALIGAGALVHLSLESWAAPAGWIELAARAPEAKEFNPLALSGLVSSAAVFFGLAGGGLLMKRGGGFDAGGPILQRLARYLLGLVGVILIWFGLDLIFPGGEAPVPYLFRYVRYALTGLWAAYLAPALFIRLKIAKTKTG
jgi:membrane-associated phospholipid phosphatase